MVHGLRVLRRVQPGTMFAHISDVEEQTPRAVLSLGEREHVETKHTPCLTSQESCIFGTKEFWPSRERRRTLSSVEGCSLNNFDPSTEQQDVEARDKSMGQR